MIIYNKVVLWNIQELVKNDDGGFSLLRLPLSCEKSMLEQGKNMNKTAVGVEFRFIPRSQVTFYLKSKDVNMTQAQLYLGSVQASWDQSYFTVSNKEITKIIITPLKNEEEIAFINKGKKSSFDSRVYRLIFDYTEFELFDIEGDFEEIKEIYMPQKRYLAYGSSITSSSLTYIQELSYPSLIAKDLGYDLINLGFPGSCRLEKEVADYIANFNNFDIATIELGINVIDTWSITEFKEKVHYFLSTVINKHLDKLFFITDIFSYFNECCSGVKSSKVEAFCSVIEKEISFNKWENVIYVKGSYLLPNRYMLCADLVHPDIDGHALIYKNFVKVIRDNITN